MRATYWDAAWIGGARNDVAVDVALMWTAGPRTRIRGFVDNARVRRGMHLRGLARGLFEAFVALDPGRFRTVHHAAFREVLHPGLVAALQVKLEHPRFGSAMGDQLENPEVLASVAGVVTEQLAARLRDDRQLREALLARMPA